MVDEDIVTVVRVGIAEGAVVKRPQRVRTNGLGSCVGVVLYDCESGLCGMVHVMLPQSPVNKKVTPTKFADSGVSWLMEQVVAAGASKRRLKAKIAGGAQMFSLPGASDLLRIGPRNVEMVIHRLVDLKIPLVSQDVGGSQGRTIEFNSVTGILYVRTAMQGIIEI